MRREFSKRTKLDAWMRCDGKCEDCGKKILGRPEYHHVKEDFIGGEPALSNCQVLCSKCHAAITKKRRPEIDRTRSQFEKRIGLRRSSRGFRGHRKFNGEIVWNNT